MEIAWMDLRLNSILKRKSNEEESIRGWFFEIGESKKVCENTPYSLTVNDFFAILMFNLFNRLFFSTLSS